MVSNQTALWDFSIIASINFCIFLLLLGRICLTKYQSATKRNRLTFRIFGWLIANQIVVQLKQTVEVVLTVVKKEDDQLLRYTIAAIESQIFVTACFIQLLEWHLIAFMVKFQSSRHLTLLDV